MDARLAIRMDYGVPVLLFCCFVFGLCPAGELTELWLLAFVGRFAVILEFMISRSEVAQLKIPS